MQKKKKSAANNILFAAEKGTSSCQRRWNVGSENDFSSQFTEFSIPIVAVGVEALPVPAVADHVVDAELGFPSEFVFGLGGVAVAGCDVASGAGWCRVW